MKTLQTSGTMRLSTPQRKGVGGIICWGEGESVVSSYESFAAGWLSLEVALGRD